jgi:hypothetical protein
MMPLPQEKEGVSVRVDLLASCSIIEEVMKLLEKYKEHEQELQKRDVVIQQAIMKMGEENSNNNGEVNQFVKDLLSAEVPRLILQEYDTSRSDNQQM